MYVTRDVITFYCLATIIPSVGKKYIYKRAKFHWISIRILRI